MTEHFKAIETLYAGCRFRSRLEARWAVFFDTLGIEWVYEKEGYRLEPLPPDVPCSCCPREQCTCREHLGGYLPDFWLPSISTWFEVKGEKPDEETGRRLWRFSQLIDQRLIVAIGSIPDPATFDTGGHPQGGAFDMWLNAGQDYHYAWCACPWCGKYGIEFDARSARICGWKSHGISEAEAWEVVKGRPGCWRTDDKCYTGDDPGILKGYATARSARFEHGEKP